MGMEDGEFDESGWSTPGISKDSQVKLDESA